MEIRDPIHGNIDVNETELKIINTAPMQRLRYIKQLDMTYLVFPGANHSRFEHSLGTMQVTKELVKSMYGDKESELSYVGLLHDIGHGPFSHLSEHLIEKYLKKNHEQLGEMGIRNSQIKDIITDSGMSFSKIMSYFRDAYKIDIVGGTLGSDRIDYLMRDSHYTGVAYGIIDYERLKSRLVLSKGKMAIMESGISGAESMLIARYFMHSNVYAHHTKVIANNMLQRAISRSLEDGALDASELCQMYDEELTSRLAASKIKSVSTLMQRLYERKLFKRVYYGDVKPGIKTEELEEDIMKLGFEKEDFVVRLVHFSGAKDDINVVDSDGKVMGKLTGVSPFMKTLSIVLKDYYKLLVASDKKNIEKISGAVRKFVG